MPLLEIAETRRYVSATVRITDITAQRIDQYAAFTKSTADEVVDKGLAYVFSKDKEFQEYLESPQAAKVPNSLKARPIGQSSAVPVPANGTAKATQPTEAAHDTRARS